MTATIDSGSGAPVVLLHGQPGEGADWQPLARVLEPQFRVIAPDRPGWGENSGPARGFAGNADWLEQFLSERVGNATVVVVGHSFGGGVAIALAERHPDRVRALVLVGSVGHAVAISQLDRLLALPVLGDAIVRGGTVAARGVVSLARRTLERIGPASGVVRQAESMSILRVLCGEEPVPEDAWRSFTIEQKALVRETAELERGLAAVRVPTVVVAGARDRVVRVDASRALAAAVPGAELAVLEGAGHLVPQEQPERLAALLFRYDRITRHDGT